MPPALRENSLLLLTRFDKLLSERDRERVLRRVRTEAGGVFRGVYPIALTMALAADDDRTRWEASGAEAFLQALLDMATTIGGAEVGPDMAAPGSQPAASGGATLYLHPAARSDGGGAGPAREPAVMPRRVAINPDRQTTRPTG